MSFLAPFVAFGDAIERDTMMALYGMPKLYSLGPSTMGELCFNTEFPSIGLICGAHNEEITNVLRRLIDSDPETEVLVLHTDNSSVSDTVCALATPESRIYVSPRNLERAFRLYQAVGQEALPLSFDRTEVALKHVLAFFSPREEGGYSQEILHHIQHVVSQLEESFDLQRFNELVGKEEWSGSGESFIALRQTIFTMMVSSSGRDYSPSYAPKETIVDLTDPILSDTGLDSVLMEMVLKRFLETGAPQKMVVFNNASDFMGSISRSLESLATLGSGRPASIVIATTDPQILPLKILNSLDYVVSGPNRSLLSREFLEKHFAETAIPRDKPQDGRMLIWSPNSLLFGNDAEFDEEGFGFGKSWDRTLAYARFEFFNRSSLSPVKEHRVGEEYARSILAMSEKWFQPAEPSTPHSSSMDMSQEDGMVPIPEYLRADVTLDGRRPSTRDSSCASREFKAAEDVQSKLVEEGGINNTRVPVIDETRGSARRTQHLPSSPPFAGGSSSKGGGSSLDKPGKHAHLIKALLKAGNGQVGVWVDFEAVRKLVGNNTEVKALGFPSYTSMVKEARDENIIERRSNGNDSYSIRLAPPSSALKSRNKSPDSREKSKVAQSARSPGILNINDLSQMMRSKSTPPPGITTDSIRELASTSKAGTQTLEGSSRTPITNPPSATTHNILVDDYPEAHRPVVTAMQNLKGGILGTEVATGPLHGELRRMGFTKANQTPSNMVLAATIARVIRCFRDKGGRSVAVLEEPKRSRSSRPLKLS